MLGCDSGGIFCCHSWVADGTQTFVSEVLFSYSLKRRLISSSRTWNLAGSFSRCSSEHSSRQRGGSISASAGRSRMTLSLGNSEILRKHRNFLGKYRGPRHYTPDSAPPPELFNVSKRTLRRNPVQAHPGHGIGIVSAIEQRALVRFPHNWPIAKSPLSGR